MKTTTDPALSGELPPPTRSTARESIGLAALCGTLAIQLALTAMLLLDPPPRPTGGLSQWGAYSWYPEREVAVYLACLAGALVLAALLARPPVRAAGKGAPGSPKTGGANRPLATTWARMLLAGGLTVAYLAVFMSARAYGARQEAVPAGFVVAFALLALLTAGAILVASRSASLKEVAAPDLPSGRWRFSIWDLAVPAGIVLLVYVPAYRQVAGRIFVEESLLHWDYFAMGPALLFRHGQALGTEVLNYYGAGWPMLFALLDPAIPISYGRMIQIGSLYLCLYLAGFYLLLRLVVRSPIGAAAGTALAAGTLFYWMQGLDLWRAPNVTPMRWAFDVWCLIALVLSHRTGKLLWAALGGAALGLAVVFNFNAGIELAAACLLYWLCISRAEGRASRRDGTVFGAAALIVGLTGMAVAGRGGILSPAFWRGWFTEPLAFLNLPLATGTETPIVVVFTLLAVFYMTLAGNAVVRAVQRRASFFDSFNGAVGLYGLLVQVKFLRHSAGMTFPRLLMPAAILVTVLISRAVAERSDSSGHGRPSRAVALAVAGLLAALALLLPRLVVDPLLDYPNLLSAAVRGTDPNGVCLIAEPRDLCGLPTAMAEGAVEFGTITDRLAALHREGRTVGVVDETGSLFYIASGAAPTGRFTRVFTTPYTNDLLDRAVEPFRSDPPDYLLYRLPIAADSPDLAEWAGFGTGPREDSPYSDAWRAFGEVVADRYELEATTGPFQLWRRTG